MLSIKDFESIKNISTIICIPFIAAALITDGILINDIAAELIWLTESSFSAIKIIGWALSLITTVTIAALAFCIFDLLIVEIHVSLGNRYILPLIAMTLLTAGLFVLSILMPNIPKSPLNPFWHMAFIAYGFNLIDRAGK